MLDQLHQGLHEELSIAITKARGGKDAGTIATHVLTNDQSGSLLVGIVEEGRTGILPSVVDTSSNPDHGGGNDGW